MKYKIGIDVGGTFTDFLLAYEDGTTQIYKVLSTPDDPSIGLITGLQQMADDRNISMQEFIRDVDTIVHGANGDDQCRADLPGSQDRASDHGGSKRYLGDEEGNS
jgi:predicted NBD/HSP70 family sugar kinase